MLSETWIRRNKINRFVPAINEYLKFTKTHILKGCIPETRENHRTAPFFVTQNENLHKSFVKAL
jgi:hypothetical protein